MLRDPLAGCRNLVLHREPRTQLEQALTVSLRQFVENGSPDRRRNGFEDVAHRFNLKGKCQLAY
jgi:hypothetical protein